jgi:uncharacterized membrane protein YfcA
VDWQTGLFGLLAGFLIAVITAPVGVSGAVFLLPVQLSLLEVPNPSVTPTNLLYNVVATPGALLRYARNGQLWSPLARLLVIGTMPGVVLGAVLRVFVVPGAQAFKLIVAAVLLPLGGWLVVRALRRHQAEVAETEVKPAAVTGLAGIVGVIGGIYGIGGGSILGPILAGRGLPMARVAPAALLATFVTSVVGSLTYALLALARSGDISPDWPVGLMCGLGGLLGGYVGARLQPHLPERALRLLLGALAVGLAVMYAASALT